MDALAAAALSYDYKEGPKLVRFVVPSLLFYTSVWLEQQLVRHNIIVLLEWIVVIFGGGGIS
uniref:Uncharacterized protein n=1 Tax=Cannabis sativa TaxID=3483 RepID=A0A803R5V4_CANSA